MTLTPKDCVAILRLGGSTRPSRVSVWYSILSVDQKVSYIKTLDCYLDCILEFSTILDGGPLEGIF